jgi:hypothetical protein
MATRIESGQIQLRSVGGVPMQQTQLQAVDQIGFRAQAQTATTMGQILDRMSGSLFEEAAKKQEKKALVDYFENFRVTDQQIEDARNGIPVDFSLGKGFSIYDIALQKARSYELSGRFEVEAKSEHNKLYDKIVNNEISVKDAAIKMKSVTDGFSRVLGKEDGEAALKFVSSMGMHASTIMAKGFELESKRKREQDEIMLQQGLNNDIKLIEPLLEAPLELDDKGQPRSPNVILQAVRLNIGQKGTAIGGIERGNSMQTEWDKAVRQAKVNVLTKLATSDENIGSPESVSRTLNDLRNGRLGKLTHIAQDLYAVDRTALDDVSKSVMQAVADRRTLNEDVLKEDKRKKEADANTLMIEFHQKGTPMKRKEDIAMQVAKMGIFSIEQLDKYLSPEQKDGDPYAYANIETRIVFGDITDPAELKRVAMRSGMSGQQYTRLNSKLLEGYTQEKSDAVRYLRRVSGVPDVASMFSSAGDEIKIEKNNKLNDIFESQVNTFRQTNPGAPIPYKQIARDVEKEYNAGDRTDANKEKARQEIKQTIEALVGKKKLPADIVIDENTSINDISKKYKLSPDDETYLRQRQNTLRGGTK